ncbi:MAG: ATP-binding protein [Kiritimatiellales bacterium]|nr:ATP-binding protein [Kiritimatiellales bacterium]
MIPRKMADKLVEMATGFPVVCLTGPRQSGKTTLVKSVFADYAYVSLENMDTMLAAKEDPRRFLAPYKDSGLIVDEAQRVPELFSYLQGVVDASGKMGRYILTGSQNFLLLESITQSLAGRAAILHLLPFSVQEVENVGLLEADLDKVLFKGMYPPLFDRPVSPIDFYPSYIETYLERDVRSMKNIGNLALFRKFVQLSAGRIGQMLNLTSLGNETGVDHKTIRSWLSVLEASFIVFLLRPYHRNWNKRIVKQPKLYFYDTGLLCSLLNLRSADDLAMHHLRGSIYENYVIAEHMKKQCHFGIRPSAYFWRDHTGHEIDLIIEKGNGLQAVEIKSTTTLNPGLFNGLRWFCDQTGLVADDCSLVYGGEEPQERAAGRAVPWRQVHSI